MIVCDTGPLVSAAVEGDDDHARCVELFNRLHLARREMVVPGTVVAEVGYLLGRELGSRAEARFLRSLGSGAFVPIDLGAIDYLRAAELVEEYGDFPLGTTDATVIALAERLGAVEVATLDHRHFSVVRPRHTRTFTLLPE